jgi:hypothetical protein
VQIGYDAAGLRASELTGAGATFYVGDLFEYERTPGGHGAHLRVCLRRLTDSDQPGIFWMRLPIGERPTPVRWQRRGGSAILARSP